MVGKLDGRYEGETVGDLVEKGGEVIVSGIFRSSIVPCGAIDGDKSEF